MTSEDAALDRLVAAGGPGVRPVPYGAHADQVYEEYGPAEAPLVVVVHGGFWRPTIDRAHARPQARGLAALGWRVVLAEYRRVPGDPQMSLDDLESLHRHLGDEGVWLGHSAGGTLVLLTALRAGVRAVALAPVVDLGAARQDRLGDGAVDLWLGATSADLVDPAALVVSCSSARRHELEERVRLVHGAADLTVPASQSSRSGLPADVIDGAHHYDLIDPESDHWSRVVDAIRGIAGTRPQV